MGNFDEAVKARHAERFYTVDERKVLEWTTEAVTYSTTELRELFGPGTLVSALLDEIDRLRGIP